MSRCIPPEELGRVLSLGADAPERRHVEACPRCRARMLSYREFLEDLSIPAGADPMAAGPHLREAFRRASETGEVSPRAAEARAASRAAARLRTFADRLGRPLVLVPTAAVILLAIGLFAGRDLLRTGPGPDQLRGADTPAGIAGEPIRSLEPRHGTDRVELRWRSIPEATSYEVVIIGEELTDLARLSAALDTTCVVRWSDLMPPPRSGAVLGWQVVGLRDGATIARSPIGAIRVP